MTLLFYTILASTLGFLEIKDTLSIWLNVGQNDYLDYRKFNGYIRASPEIKTTLEFYIQWIALLKFILGIILIVTALVLPSNTTTTKNIYSIIYSNYLRGILSLCISFGYLFHLYKFNDISKEMVQAKQLSEGLDVALDFIYICVISPLFAVASFLQFRSVYKLKSYLNNNNSGGSKMMTNGTTNGSISNGHVIATNGNGHNNTKHD